MTEGSVTDVWNAHGLWMKAKLCVQRSQAADLDSPDQTLWAALALELLARSALATLHPVLLADPADAKNILHAFGVNHPKGARSIPARTVFDRCAALVAGFGEREVAVAGLLADRRNLELHTAVLGKEEMPTRIWLRDYYRATQRLTDFMERDIDYYLGEEANALRRMLAAEEEEEVRTAAAVAVASAKANFESLTDEERRDRASSSLELDADSDGTRTTRAVCPACGSGGVLGGSHVRYQAAELDESAGSVVVTQIIVGEKFSCPVCGLNILGHPLLHEVGLGGEFSVVEEHDPIKYYDLQIDAADLFEPEYGND